MSASTSRSGVEPRSASDRGEAFVEFGLEDVARIVGGLPPSAARSRQWWADGSNVQSRSGGMRASRAALGGRIAAHPGVLAPELSVHPRLAPPPRAAGRR